MALNLKFRFHASQVAGERRYFFRMFVASVAVLVFSLVGPVVFASEFCRVIDGIVLAGEESPPFDSVIHLSLPESNDCRITGEWENSTDSKSKRFYCVWEFPELWKPYKNLEARVEDAEEARDDAFDEWMEASDEYNEIISENLGYYSSEEEESHNRTAKANNLYEALNKEYKRIRDEHDRLYDEIDEQIEGHAETMLRGIRGCFHDKKIRGRWGPFETSYSDDYFVWTTALEGQDCGYSHCLMDVGFGDSVYLMYRVYK